MSKHNLVVFSNPVEGQEDEYNDWYTNTHLHDVIKIPGFIAAQRFVLSDEQMQSETPYRYMAVYEIETDDLKDTLSALGQAIESGMEISSAIDMENIGYWIFTPITDRILSKGT
jgi:hypothetical protein